MQNQKPKSPEPLSLVDVLAAQDAVKSLFDKFFALTENENDPYLSQKMLSIASSLQDTHLHLIKLESIVVDMAVEFQKKQPVNPGWFKKSAVVLLALGLNACSTVSTRYSLTDPQARTESRQIVDGKACETYHWGSKGNRYLDENYYYACMQEKGYTLQSQKIETTDYLITKTSKPVSNE